VSDSDDQHAGILDAIDHAEWKPPQQVVPIPLACGWPSLRPLENSSLGFI
jgi:hypothetical protein